MKNYAEFNKKSIFSKCLSFYWPFFMDIITPVILSTNIAYDATACNSLIFTWSTEKNLLFL